MCLGKQPFRTHASGAFTAGYAVLSAKCDRLPASVSANGTIGRPFNPPAAHRCTLRCSMPSRFPIACGLTPDEAHILVVLWHFLS